MDGFHKDVECSSSRSRNCIDTVERHSFRMGVRVHKAKKFFSLRRKFANSGQSGHEINNRSYSDLVYDTLHRPQRDIDNQNRYGCDDRYANWKRMPSSQRRYSGLRMVLLTVKERET